MLLKAASSASGSTREAAHSGSACAGWWVDRGRCLGDFSGQLCFRSSSHVDDESQPARCGKAAPASNGFL